MERLPGAVPEAAVPAPPDQYVPALTKYSSVDETTFADSLSGRASLQEAAPRNESTDPGLDSRGLESSDSQFWFAVSADMRQFSGPGEYDTQQYFRGACQAIAALGAGAFMVSPGDIDPPADVEWTIRQCLGQDYIWYPVVGNHESETPEDMAWLRSYDYDTNGDTPPNIVSLGPAGCQETTYSFDYGNSHFVVLNQYYDGASDTGTNGDVVDGLYTWLMEDLAATTQKHIFVFGHEPAYPQPDADNGRLRHQADSLNQHPINRDRFWDLLKDEGVIAYFCGHTHNYSAVEIGGVWQVDVGHARGKGDTGARSTFVLIHVEDDLVRFESYRDDANGGPYVLDQRGILNQPAVCPTFLDGVATGTVESGLLFEISGLAASRNHANVLWVHNDSGDLPRIYALSSQGELLATYDLAGASAIDWEDIAIGPGPTPGQDHIYIGDTGDNARRRSSVTVYRVAEPLVNASQDPVTLGLSDVAAFPMQYPGTVYDSETLLVDPVSGDIFLVTRDREGSGAAYVFRNPSPHTAGVLVTLELVATIPLPLEVKGGDVSPSGDAVLLRPHSYSGYEDGYYWPRAAGTNLWDAFSGTSCVVPLIEEPQGEALGFAADGLGYYTISEGTHQPIYFYENPLATQVQIPMAPGWNLVSASLSSAAIALTDALCGIEGKYDLVYAFDAADADPWKKHDAEGPPFTNDLTEIDGTMGLWIRVTEPVTLTVSGCVPPSTDVSLYAGWNLVACPLRAAQPITQALSSIEGLYNLVYAYEASHTSGPWKMYDPAGPQALNGLLEMQPGHGYWLRVSEDCTWRLVP